MGLFSKKNDVPKLIYIDNDYMDVQKDVITQGPAYVPFDYERKQLYLDVLRIGLSQLVAVHEVLAAANAVLADYDSNYGPAGRVDGEVEFQKYFDSLGAKDYDTPVVPSDTEPDQGA